MAERGKIMERTRSRRNSAIKKDSHQQHHKHQNKKQTNGSSNNMILINHSNSESKDCTVDGNDHVNGQTNNINGNNINPHHNINNNNKQETIYRTDIDKMSYPELFSACRERGFEYSSAGSKTAESLREYLKLHLTDGAVPTCNHDLNKGNGNRVCEGDGHKNTHSSSEQNEPARKKTRLSSEKLNNSGENITSESSSSSAVKSSTIKKKFVQNDTTKMDTRTNIAPSILSCIGNTPLVQLNHIPKSYNIPCEIVAKCEFFNAGGSVKDRIGLQMILDAEKEGKIKPGDTLIEPTSGNTGIGLALASAVKGYKCIIVLPEKMSKEKVDVLKALGAEIVRTPTEAAYDAPDSHISVAKRLQTEIPNSHILDQYKNESNPLAHYHGTAEEIWMQCNGKVDMLVAGAGTGGTISGIARKLKEYNPDIIVIGVDPEGSILAQPSNLNDYKRLEPYAVEGIGYDFVPDVLNRKLVDKWYKSNDTDSLVMMRKMIRDEGFLCGGSCGSAMSIALKAVQDFKLTKDQRCVVVLPDSVRNYMTKALSDDWMLDHSFIDNDVIKPKKIQTWWADHYVRDIPMATPLTITSKVTCKAAIALLKSEGFDMVPVIGDNGSVIGVVTEGNISSQILAGRVKSDKVSVEEAKVIYKTFRKVGMNERLADLAHALDHEPFVLVVTEQRCFNVENKIQTKTVVSGIITRIDLLDYISKGSDDRSES